MLILKQKNDWQQLQGNGSFSVARFSNSLSSITAPPPRRLGNGDHTRHW
jgi:hypothetical protein